MSYAYVTLIFLSRNFSFLILLLFVIAPSKVSITRESALALKVTISASPTSSVTKYKASSNGKLCEVTASDSPLTCTLSGLPAGELNIVEVVACLGNGVCSEPIEGTGYTLPNGRSAFSC